MLFLIFFVFSMQPEEVCQNALANEQNVLTDFASARSFLQNPKSHLEQLLQSIRALKQSLPEKLNKEKKDLLSTTERELALHYFLSHAEKLNFDKSNRMTVNFESKEELDLLSKPIFSKFFILQFKGSSDELLQKYRDSIPQMESLDFSKSLEEKYSFNTTLNLERFSNELNDMTRNNSIFTPPTNPKLYKNILSLDLSNTDFGSDFSTWFSLSSIFKQFPNLQYLNVSGTSFTHIIDSYNKFNLLDQLKNLKVLDLRGNLVSIHFFHNLLDYILDSYSSLNIELLLFSGNLIEMENGNFPQVGTTVEDLLKSDEYLFSIYKNSKLSVKID